MKIIYDLGANNGCNIPYYLSKSDLVVAVEANPTLCSHLTDIYSHEISKHKLVIINCIVDTTSSIKHKAFYIHTENSVLSQFSRPDEDQMAFYDEVFVRSIDIVDLIQQYGDPYYVKIDIEHYDHIILRRLLEAGIIPPYISAESHDIEVFALLVALGRYNSLKLVEGNQVSLKYKKVEISTSKGLEIFSFLPHSAGPFGNDIAGPWMTPNNFFKGFGYSGLGWKDIHASKIDAPDPGYTPTKGVSINVNF